jgi:hypothetical protein
MIFKNLFIYFLLGNSLNAMYFPFEEDDTYDHNEKYISDFAENDQFVNGEYDNGLQFLESGYGTSLLDFFERQRKFIHLAIAPRFMVENLLKSDGEPTFLTSAADFIWLAKYSPEAAETLAQKHSESILVHFACAADYLELAKVDSYADEILARKHSKSILALFTCVDDYLELARTPSDVDEMLAKEHGESLLLLFTRLADYLELAKASGNAARILAGKNSDYILAFLANKVHYLELAKASEGAAKILAEKHSESANNVANNLRNRQCSYLTMSWRAFGYWPEIALFTLSNPYDARIYFSLPREIGSQILSIFILLCQKESF